MSGLILLNSIEEYRHVISGKKLWNNGFTLVEIKKYISEGRLFYACNAGSCVLLYDEKRYFQLVVMDGISAEELREICGIISGNIVCFINDKAQMASRLRELLEEAEFICTERILEYELRDFSCRKASKTGMHIVKNVGNEAEYMQIQTLWQSNLPYMQIPHITIDDIKMWERSERLLVLKTAENALIGASCFDTLLDRSTIHHIVVDHEYRGCGLMQELLTEWINAIDACGIKKARAWVAESNMSSRIGFEKAGFKMTSTVSYQFEKNMEEK